MITYFVWFQVEQAGERAANIAIDDPVFGIGSSEGSNPLAEFVANYWKLKTTATTATGLVQHKTKCRAKINLNCIVLLF